MKFDWSEILPDALSDLSSLHREICDYLLTLTGKQRPTYSYARKTWGLAKTEFEIEHAAAMTALRWALARRGVHQLTDLDIG